MSVCYYLNIMKDFIPSASYRHRHFTLVYLTTVDTGTAREPSVYVTIFPYETNTSVQYSDHDLNAEHPTTVHSYHLITTITVIGMVFYGLGLNKN